MRLNLPYLWGSIRAWIVLQRQLTGGEEAMWSLHTACFNLIFANKCAITMCFAGGCGAFAVLPHWLESVVFGACQSLQIRLTLPWEQSEALQPWHVNSPDRCLLQLKGGWGVAKMQLNHAYLLPSNRKSKQGLGVFSHQSSWINIVPMLAQCTVHFFKLSLLKYHTVTFHYSFCYTVRSDGLPQTALYRKKCRLPYFLQCIAPAHHRSLVVWTGT